MTHHQDKVVRIAVLGGTGNEGSGLGTRWANAGYDVIIGSRTKEKADKAAAAINETLGEELVHGMLNEEAAAIADIAVLTVPYAAHTKTLEGLREQLQGKIMVDVTVPIMPPKITEVYLPEGRSAAEEAQAILGDGVRVVSAFQHISHIHLQNLEHNIDSDVLICGNDADAKAEVTALIEAASMRAVDAGALANAVAIEAMTPVLLAINKRYKIKHSSMKITGLS